MSRNLHTFRSSVLTIIFTTSIFTILIAEGTSESHRTEGGERIGSRADESSSQNKTITKIFASSTQSLLSLPPDYEELNDCSADSIYAESRYLGCFLKGSLDPLYPPLQSLVITNPSNKTILVQQYTGSDCRSSLSPDRYIVNVNYVQSSSSTIELLNVNCTGLQCCFRVSVSVTGDSYSVKYRVYRYMDPSTKKQPLTPVQVAGIIIGGTVGTFIWIFFFLWSCMCLGRWRCVSFSEAFKQLCYINCDRCTVKNWLYATVYTLCFYVIIGIFGIPGLFVILACEVCCRKNILKDTRVTNFFPSSTKVVQQVVVPPSGGQDNPTGNRPNEESNGESIGKFEETVNPSVEAIVVPNPVYPSKRFVVGGGIISVKNAAGTTTDASTNQNSSRSLRNLMDLSANKNSLTSESNTVPLGVSSSLSATYPSSNSSIVVNVVDGTKDSESDPTTTNNILVGNNIGTQNNYANYPISQTRSMTERVQLIQTVLPPTNTVPSESIDPRNHNPSTNSTVSNWR